MACSYTMPSHELTAGINDVQQPQGVERVVRTSLMAPHLPLTGPIPMSVLTILTFMPWAVKYLEPSSLESKNIQ
jgi:hypothetical protein